jgi:hypothetical protein
MINTGVVLKPWVIGLPWRSQSTLFSALRGPDVDERMEDVQLVVRWIRGVVQNDACVAEGRAEACTYMLPEWFIPAPPDSKLNRRRSTSSEAIIPCNPFNPPPRTYSDISNAMPRRVENCDRPDSECEWPNCCCTDRPDLRKEDADGIWRCVLLRRRDRRTDS